MVLVSCVNLLFVLINLMVFLLEGDESVGFKLIVFVGDYFIGKIVVCVEKC